MATKKRISRKAKTTQVQVTSCWECPFFDRAAEQHGFYYCEKVPVGRMGEKGDPEILGKLPYFDIWDKCPMVGQSITFEWPTTKK